MKKIINVFVVFVLLMCSCVVVLGYDDAYFVEAENGFLANEVEDASKAVSMVEASKNRAVQASKVIRVPLKVTRKSDGNYFMWSDMSLITFNGEVGFCIDPLIKINMSANYSSNAFHTVLDESKRDRISKIMYYGYSFENHKSDNYYLATQKLIWECLGYKVKYYAKNSNFTGNYDVSKEESEIVRLLNDHDKTISFDGQSLEMCVGDVIELCDDHLVLKDYVVDYEGEALEIEKVDQMLRICAKKAIDEDEIYFRKGDYQVEGALIKVHKAKNAQPFVTMEKGALEPLIAKLNLKVHALGDFELVKIDKETQKGLEGVVFEISTDVNFKENVHRYVTDAEGKIDIKNLVVGTYYYREVETIEPYIRDKNTNSFTIVENECTKVVCENSKQQFQLKIKKEAVSTNDLEASSASLEGAEYVLLSSDKSTVIERVKASGTEAVVQTLLDVDTTYYVQEVVAPKGMELNPELIEIYVPYQIEQGYLVKEVTCYDEVIKNRIDITKYVHKYQGEVLNKEFGEDFVFEIYNSNNKLVDTMITDKNGMARSSLLPYGEYTVIENTKDGYHAIEPFHVTIESSTKSYHYDVVNEVIDYQLEILKTDTNQEPLAHVRFALSDDKNMQNVLMVKETDEHGKLVFHHLVPNTYYVQEQYVDERYVLDSTIHEIKVVKDTQKTFVNAFKEVKLQIYKCDEDKQPLENVEFKVTGNNGIEKIGNTDKTGKLVFMLPYGEYEIEEIGTPKGYMELDEAISLVIDEDKEYEVEVVNERKLVELQIYKCDEDKQPLENAEFKVTGNNGVEKMGSTDKDGKLVFMLPYGEYEIEEIGTPKGYMELDETISLVIDEERVYELEIVNKKVPFVDTASTSTPPWILVVMSVIGIGVGIYLRIYS